jgi:hypothetical protein
MIGLQIYLGTETCQAFFKLSIWNTKIILILGKFDDVLKLKMTNEFYPDCYNQLRL